MDPGLAAVESVFGQLEIDDEWSVKSERGFSWWAHKHAQHVWADGPVPSEDLMVSRVNVETDLFRAEISRESEAILSIVQRAATMNGLVREGSLVRTRCSAWVHQENAGWLSKLLAFASLIQLMAAERTAEDLAEGFKGHVANSHHPESGPRGEPDEMLDTLELLPHAPAGWDDPDEIASVVESLGEYGLLANGVGSGFVVEFPFGEAGGPAAIGGESNLLEVGPESHPALGDGIRLTLRLLRWPTVGGVQVFPTSLNEREKRERVEPHFLGSWAIQQDPDSLPFFTSFLPHVLHRPGILLNLVLSFGVRSNWVAPFLTGQQGSASGRNPTDG